MEIYNNVSEYNPLGMWQGSTTPLANLRGLGAISVGTSVPAAEKTYPSKTSTQCP
jgi:hypothetical protein